MKNRMRKRRRRTVLKMRVWHQMRSQSLAVRRGRRWTGRSRVTVMQTLTVVLTLTMPLPGGSNICRGSIRGAILLHRQHRRLLLLLPNHQQPLRALLPDCWGACHWGYSQGVHKTTSLEAGHTQRQGVMTSQGLAVTVKRASMM
jgi:hypothetical protein